MTRADSIKYLGIIFDSNIKWNIYVKNICDKVRHLIYFFNKLRNYFSIERLKQLYHALFLAIALYGIIAWGSGSWNNVRPIEIIHKRLIKSMLGLTILFPTENLFEISKLLDKRLNFFLVAISQFIKTNKVKYVKNSLNTRIMK